jgi:hypothetical protein
LKAAYISVADALTWTQHNAAQQRTENDDSLPQTSETQFQMAEVLSQIQQLSCSLPPDSESLDAIFRAVQNWHFTDRPEIILPHLQDMTAPYQLEDIDATRDGKIGFMQLLVEKSQDLSEKQRIQLLVFILDFAKEVLEQTCGAHLDGTPIQV